MRYDFASDNAAGMCPEAWTAMEEANEGFVSSYGDDAWTARAADAIREAFETDCAVFFVFNGTAANALALAAACRPFNSVICHDQAHAERDECGAPEFFTGGSKVELAGGPNGKIDPAPLDRFITERRQVHSPKPGAISITQSTELGTIYQPGEIAALAATARRHGMILHMDGARLANAIASTALAPRALTWEAGVDVLSLGGTKNGLAIGEAIVVFRRELAVDLDFRIKQAGHLCSKMRFIAAPWLGLLRDGAWLRHAAHANAMARLLAERLAEIPRLRLVFPVEANGVFVDMPAGLPEALAGRGWRFYHFIGERGYRLMCSWRTTRTAVDAFAADVSDGLKTLPA
jgi:threonine aldolase